MALLFRAAVGPLVSEKNNGAHLAGPNQLLFTDRNLEVLLSLQKLDYLVDVYGAPSLHSWPRTEPC